MKIAITGHSAGIGQALAKAYEKRGHEIVGLSRRNGFNIRSILKLASEIEPCDIFVNNAQAGYAQTELLCEIHKRWQGQHKQILVIGTQMTQAPVPSKTEWTDYWLQKKALDQAVWTLSGQSHWPCITLVKPGAVATQPGQSLPNYADTDQWAETLIHTLESIDKRLRINEISLGVNYHG